MDTAAVGSTVGMGGGQPCIDDTRACGVIGSQLMRPASAVNGYTCGRVGPVVNAKAKRVVWLCATLIIVGCGLIVSGVALETSAAESVPAGARLALFIIGGLCCVPPSYYLLHSRQCCDRMNDPYQAVADTDAVK